jgi:hypothetical protein
MISTFSDAGYLIARPPIPAHAFFQQTVLEGEIGDSLLQGARLAAQLLHFIRGRGARRVARQAPLAGLQELLRPAVVLRRGDALTPAQLRDAVLAAQTIQHDPDLLLGRKMPPRLTPDVLQNLFRCFLLQPRFLSHLRSLLSYDEPEFLPS